MRGGQNLGLGSPRGVKGTGMPGAREGQEPLSAASELGVFSGEERSSGPGWRKVISAFPLPQTWPWPGVEDPSPRRVQ